MHLAALYVPTLKAHDDGKLASASMTAVAIDKDKNSQHAVKWAVEQLFINTATVVLIHVRSRNPVNQSSPEAETKVDESEMTQLFLPYKGLCARKGMQMKEVVLEDTNVSKAVIEYITANNILNIVVGASTKNAFTRKFRNPDVPTCLLKGVPDFCAVYVVSKGRAVSVRAAKRPVPISVEPPRLPSILGNRRDFAPLHLLEKGSFERPMYMKTPSKYRQFPRITPNNMLLDNLDSTVRSQKSSESSDELDFHGSLGSMSSMGSMDFGDSPKCSSVSIGSSKSSSVSIGSSKSSSVSTGSSKSSYSPGSSKDIEVEMRRLRLELKQTMDMYNTACKEAVTAKQKARELHQWKIEEILRFEESRNAEEALLGISEMEKAKSKATTEASDAAQRIAELDAQRRLNFELRANSDQYKKFHIDDIEVATNCFSESQKIGEGGYGHVYRAVLDHTPVAIKVLRPDAAQGKKQFQQEVEVLGYIRHPNMVLLLGACPEYGCLVYEYMDNGSLEDRLFRKDNTPPIPWSVRFKIAAEIATGLLFLHQNKPEPLVHRDLKPANILLDRNYTSKISDVGLARLVPASLADSVTQYRMTSAAGTFCYIDPEYQQTGMLGVKSDIYSLGIMLLQIITAKPPMGLTHYVERAIERGTFADMLDPTVTDWPVEEALSFARLSLKCAELRKKDRPDLGKVILPELNRLRNLGNES